MSEWSRREFARTCAVGAAAALASEVVATVETGTKVSLDVIGLCAVHKATNTLAHLGLVNPEYFRHLGLHEHAPEIAIQATSIDSIEGDKGLPASSGDQSRWRSGEARGFTKWSLFHRRVEFERAAGGTIDSSVARTAKLRAALVAAGHEADLRDDWYTNRNIVHGLVRLTAGVIADGRERDKNYRREFHTTRWIYQPYDPANRPVDQNNLNDCVTCTVEQVSAIKLYELTGSVPVATIRLKTSATVYGYVANLVAELDPASSAPGVLHHVLAYYALFKDYPRHMSGQQLSTLPVPVGNPKEKLESVASKRGRPDVNPEMWTNGDVYCPGGTP